MVWNRKFILAEVRGILILGAFGLLMTWAGLACRDCIHNTRDFWIIGSFTALIWIFLWKGNEYLGGYVSAKISWFDYPVTRLLVGIVTTIAYTFFVLYALGYLYAFLFDVNLTRGAMYSVVISIIISLFMHGRAFFLNWRDTKIDAEKLKRENIAARYESLKNQVNPHFLFNSFNALSNLVYEDPDKAVKFIKQLSEVYRYVLDTREKEVVPLQDELDFLKSYVYLQQIRFGNKLKIEIELAGQSGSIAPLALQMLIENAIKHNIVSEEDPLIIKVYNEDGFIVVENNFQKKTVSVEPSAGVGLENICNRYQFLSNKTVQVEKSETTFKVKLPVLSETSI
jgi:LytS/YehU family sensor histidine kinase